MSDTRGRLWRAEVSRAVGRFPHWTPDEHTDFAAVNGDRVIARPDGDWVILKPATWATGSQWSIQTERGAALLARRTMEGDLARLTVADVAALSDRASDPRRLPSVLRYGTPTDDGARWFGVDLKAFHAAVGPVMVEVKLNGQTWTTDLDAGQFALLVAVIDRASGLAGLGATDGAVALLGQAKHVLGTRKGSWLKAREALGPVDDSIMRSGAAGLDMRLALLDRAVGMHVAHRVRRQDLAAEPFLARIEPEANTGRRSALRIERAGPLVAAVRGAGSVRYVLRGVIGDDGTPAFTGHWLSQRETAVVLSRMHLFAASEQPALIAPLLDLTDTTDLIGPYQEEVTALVRAAGLPEPEPSISALHDAALTAVGRNR